MHEDVISAEDSGFLQGQRFLIHDRDTKFTAAFQRILKSTGIESIKLPPMSPNLNAFAERWIRSAKSECLSKLVFFGEEGLYRAVREFWSTIERNAIIRGCTMCFSSQLPTMRRSQRPRRSNAKSDRRAA